MFEDNGPAYNASQSQFGGGGFMPEKTESPAGGKGGRARGEQTILPVTIKQITDAAATDDAIKIDDRDVNQVVIMGAVLSMESQALANNYTVDDGTGTIEVRWWTDAEQGDMHADKRSAISEMTYVRVVGKIRNFQSQKQVVAFDVRPVTDFNEITYHLINSIQVHLAHTTQPAAAQTGNAEAGFVYGAAPASQNTAPAGGTGMPGADNGLDEIQKLVMNIIEQRGGGETGCKFGDVKAELGARFSEQQLRDSLEFLSGEGHLYSTIDEDHFKATASEY
jgi:replication factor A2